MIKVSRLISLATLALAGIAPLSAATVYTIDAGHTSVLFSAKRQGVVNVHGRFNEIEGSVEYDEANPAASSISFTIKTESVDSNNERRDNHLRSPDFFNSQQFADMVFKSTSVKKTGDHSFEVQGQFSLHGVTKSITAEVTHTGSSENARRGTKSMGFETHFVLKRSEFDMNFMQDVLSDDIQITLAIHAVSRPAE